MTLQIIDLQQTWADSAAQRCEFDPQGAASLSMKAQFGACVALENKSEPAANVTGMDFSTPGR